MRPPFADLSQSAIIRSHLDNSSVIAVSGEGGNVISLHRDGQVRRWLNGRPKVLWTVPTKGDAASGCIGVKAAGLVSDGRLVIVGLEGELSGPWTEVPSLACTIEGEILAVTERAGSWRHYDLRTGHAVDQPLRRALFQVSMPDDAALPRALAGDLLSMWRLGSTDVLFALTHRGDIWLQTRRGWLELSYREFQFPKAFAMSPDGRFVAVGNELREVWVWFVDTGQLVLRLNGPNGPVSALAWTPDGELLVGSLDGTIRVYAASAGQLAAEACRLLREAPEDVARLCGQYWGK